MTNSEMITLKNEYGKDIEITDATHLHDEDEWNQLCIFYKGIIVGSELVSVGFVKDQIENLRTTI